jgi:hypothetical protein
MTNHARYESSSLFLLRIWREEVDDRVEWCGDVRRVVSGKGHGFRGWQALEMTLLGLLRDPTIGGAEGTDLPNMAGGDSNPQDNDSNREY